MEISLDAIAELATRRAHKWARVTLNTALRRSLVIGLVLDVIEELAGRDVVRYAVDLVEDVAGALLFGQTTPIATVANRVARATAAAAHDVAAGRTTLSAARARFKLRTAADIAHLLPPSVPAGAAGVREFAEDMSRLHGVPADDIARIYLGDDLDDST